MDVISVYGIYILDEYRGKGLGRQFMDFIKTYRPQATISLWVLEVNANARRFYEKNGFKKMVNDSELPENALTVPIYLDLKEVES